MGMTACYMTTDSELLERLKKMDGEELLDELEEAREQDVFDMDKLWDGLHCLLTGTPASSDPAKGDMLSEAVVGTTLFSDDEDADYIAYIMPDRLKQIVEALSCVDIECLTGSFSPEDFTKKEVYPDIWNKEDKEELKEELKEAFEGLKSWYENAAELNKGIIVSIY